MTTPVFRQIESLLSRLSREEQLRLVDEVVHRLLQAEARQPQSLFGILKWKTREEFDVEVALQEIRGEWLEEIKEVES